MRSHADIRYADVRVEALTLENQLLRETLTAYYERYRCRCRHYHCKRCAMDRKAVEVLKR